MSKFAGVKSLAGLMLAVAAVGAHAQNYAGVLVQMSDYNNDKVCDRYATRLGVSGSLSDCDHKATGFKAYAGTVVSESIALEAAYIDFGKVKPNLNGVAADGRVKSVVLAAVLRADVFRGLVLSGKAGVAATTASAKAGGLHDDEQHPAIYLGAGVEFPVYKSIKVVGSFDFTRAQIDEEKFGVSAFGLGAQFDF